MSPLDRPATRHIRRSSIAWALTAALLLPFPAGVDARPAEPGMHRVSGVQVAAAGTWLPGPLAAAAVVSATVQAIGMSPLPLDTGAAHGPARAAEPVAAPAPVGLVGYLTGTGAPGSGGVAGMLVALVLMVVSANMAGMLLARTRRFRRIPPAPRSV